MKRPLLVGNWKMNGAVGGLAEARSLVEALDGDPAANCVVICPPATLINRLRHVFQGSGIALGGQDCHAQASGAFTGDVSAEMLAESGAEFVIVGHSERRVGHGESSAVVAAKAKAALRAGLHPIVCVGEALEDRASGRALDIVAAQTVGSVYDWCDEAAFSIAYEPVWAIGTGRIPSVSEIEAVHQRIRDVLAERLGGAADEVAILYGGSVNAGNAASVLATPHVSGALVGGASLRAADFLQIISAARAT